MTERLTSRVSSPSYQAYQILHIAFVAAPVIAGLDKFAHFLTNWDQYVSPLIPRILHVAPHTFMLFVGVIEVVAGLLVAAAPEIGAPIVGLWLCGIVVNLLTIPAFFDIALRDVGLALGAFALGRLAIEFRSER